MIPTVTIRPYVEPADYYEPPIMGLTVTPDVFGREKKWHYIWNGYAWDVSVYLPDPFQALRDPDTGIIDVDKLPRSWAICQECRGEGRSSAHLGDFTASEFHEAFDPDEQDDYFNGLYDKECRECRGTGKVKEIDWCYVDPKLHKVLEQHYREEAAYRAECAAERRMGA